MNTLLRAGVIGMALLGMTGASHAEVVTVTTGSDPIDIDWQTATIEDLPGPDGKVSFSEAMIVTDNTPGADTIEFAIPESDWQMQWLYPGYAVIYSSYSYFWGSSDPLTIDGTTQEAFTGDRNPGDAELILYETFWGNGVGVGGDNSTVTGIHGGNLSLGGANSLAYGNTGGIHITVGGAGGTTIRDNVCGTIKIEGTTNCIVTGNVAQRVRVFGNSGVRIGGPAPADRNFLTGYGYVNSEGLPSGATIQIAGTSGTLVENNWIGTTIDGLSQGNLASTMGVSLEGENHDTTILDNRIAGILGHGQGPHHAGQLFGTAIHVSGSGTGLSISNNTIGLDANDQPILGSVVGIAVGTWAYASIDGITIEDNTIAGHIYQGIGVGRDVAAARLARNRIYANGLLGIDLIPTGFGSGVTPNDALDTDTGGNGLQNFPVIATAVTNGAAVQITGTLSTAPSSEYTLDFFASPTCDPSGNGQGERYLGSSIAFTDAGGDADFDVVFSSDLVEGWVVTATATAEPIGATSEFSACATSTLGNPVTSVAVVEPASRRPQLRPSAPNPFRESTTIRYELPRAGQVELSVYDVTGRLVRTLVDGVPTERQGAIAWDGRDGAGRSVAPGVYLVRLEAESGVASQKVMRTK